MGSEMCIRDSNCELLWRQFFSLEAPCMETALSDFYLAGVHCLWIMNKNSGVPKKMPGISWTGKG